MAILGVNIDHVATLRQARRGAEPDPVEAAKVCENSGCHSIVCHLREDRRHINDNDLRRLKKEIGIRLNLEMSIAEEIVGIALDVKPDQSTLVPEKREEITTEGGLDIISFQDKITMTVGKMQSRGIIVSLFVDPEPIQIEAAKKTGARAIEIHTGRYANADNADEIEKEFACIVRAAKLAKSLGMNVYAGHGLNYGNTKKLVSIKEIEEFNIGHSIISRSLFCGLENSVKEMLRLIA